MPAWAYFTRPTNMAFHDLTTRLKPPKNLRSLLGLSLKFIPTPRSNVLWKQYERDILPRFSRDLEIKTYMADKIDDESTNEFNPRLYVRSTWKPPQHLFPFPTELSNRLATFKSELHRLVRPRQCPSNLLPHQRKALKYLQKQEDFLVVQCDKNLGPAIIERQEYIQLAFRDHLNDSKTYKFLSPALATRKAEQIKNDLEVWMKRHKKILTRDEKRFLRHHIRNNVTPFATFYVTMKVQKTPLKTRPIVSCSGSLLEALGVWVDDKLQPIARQQKSYFKSSFDLKLELSTLELPPNARLFTADAVSMYTNIPTSKALYHIGRYLRSNHFPDTPVEALIDALRLVMKNNVFTFGDCTFRQLTGTAMGTPPAPPWATLYYALCENGFLDDYSENLLLYRRFIDDVLGIWIPTENDPDLDQHEWEEFQSTMNNGEFELEWKFSPLLHTVDFMDLTISIRDRRIHTTLYEKPSNLHLYIPPHSCHPPGLLSGVVFGMVYRIRSLCSDPTDAADRITSFFRQLQRRGYQPSLLRPLFGRALESMNKRDAATVPTPTDARHQTRQTLFFHLRYHPLNPPSQDIQHIWRSCIAMPPHSTPLEEVRNYARAPVGINRLIIAYNRPLNLGNLLSYRKLKDTASGPPVSSFMARDT